MMPHNISALRQSQVVKGRQSFRHIIHAHFTYRTAWTETLQTHGFHMGNGAYLLSESGNQNSPRTEF